MPRFPLCAAILAAASAHLAAAPPEFATIFADSMVLQRDAAAPVWGRAEPGKSVTVVIAGQSATATADAGGRWKVTFTPISPPPDNASQTMTASADGETATISEILIGDVWICAGQSNMAFRLNRDEDGATAAAAANDPLIRICDVGGRRTDLGEPTPDDLESADWKIAGPETVPNFSAVGYYFARDLRKSARVPIGLIDTSVGGTPMRCWMSRKTLESDSILRPQVATYDEEIRNRPERVEKYERQLAAYEKRGKTGQRPYAPKPLNSSYRLAYFHDSVIAPLQPMAMKGVIWYQGEADSGRHATFRHQFATLVAEWRGEWARGDFPWLFVQLAPFSEPTGRQFPLVWEAQEKSMEIPNSAMVVSLDSGEAKNIHPPHKAAIGARLALAARALAYGETTAWRAPVFGQMAKRDGKIFIRFKDTGDGLTAGKDGLKFFTIAGPDRKFVPAEAEITGKDTVAVSSSKVPHPAAVRYGWYEKRAPVGASLFRKDGMPAAPFRTDDWADQ